MTTLLADKFAYALAGDGIRGAIFSNCRRYRYRLWHIWDRSKPILLYVMLNPSTADEVKNDPTVERCARRAIMMGYGGIRIANIFALRSTDPSPLYTDKMPIDEGVYLTDKPRLHDGRINNAHIETSVRGSNFVICGWGEHGALHGRGQQVLHNLRSMCRPHALKLNKSGEPCHPLYIPYKAQPFEIK